MRQYPKILSASVILACATLCRATPYDVRSYGAKGDGIADDTSAINQAIAAAADAGGGTVEVGAGTYLAGSIHLKSDIALRLDPGSSIVATSDGSAYDAPEANSWGDTLHYQDSGHS